MFTLTKKSLTQKKHDGLSAIPSYGECVGEQVSKPIARGERGEQPVSAHCRSEQPEPLRIHDLLSLFTFTRAR